MIKSIFAIKNKRHSNYKGIWNLKFTEQNNEEKKL